MSQSATFGTSHPSHGAHYLRLFGVEHNNLFVRQTTLQRDVPLHPPSFGGRSTERHHFLKNDGEGVILPHHDALVVPFPMANYMLKIILIENGSATNILLLTAL